MVLGRPHVLVIIAGMILSTAFFALMALAGPAPVSEPDGTSLGKTAEEVTANLTAQGYEVNVNTATGMVAKIREED